MERGESSDESLRTVGEAFDAGGAFAGAEPLGKGLIHGTWAARFDAAAGARRLVIQRLNTDVFPDPERLMENVVRITEHLGARLLRDGVHAPERRCLRVVPTRAGEPLHRDAAGHAWRAFELIEGSVTCERLAGSEQAREAAYAFGSFARHLADLPGPPLHETLPRFHDFAARVAALEAAVIADAGGRAGDVPAEIEALRTHSRAIQLALDDGGFTSLPRRVAHHDCKLDNLLFEAGGRRALCVIDLDTVMPGTLLSDFGELVRSSTNTAAEDEPDPERVGFAGDLYAALARGYLAGLGPLLTLEERALLPLAGPLMTLMNAVRFLTDHLVGDVYFRIEHPGHNLDRARAQLRLAERMLEQLELLRESVGVD